VLPGSASCFSLQQASWVEGKVGSLHTVFCTAREASCLLTDLIRLGDIAAVSYSSAHLLDR